MRKMKLLFSLRAKLFMAFFLLSALITLAISYTLFLHMSTNHLDTLKRSLIVIADLATIQAEGKNIGEIATAGKDEIAQQVIRKLIQRLTEESPNITHVYLWRRVQTGGYILLADSSTRGENIANTDKEDFRVGLSVADVKRPMLLDRNRGYDMMAVAPVRDGSGAVIAILGLEVDGSLVDNDIIHFALQVFRAALLALLVVAAISWWLAGSFVHRLSRLNRAIDEMAAGKLDIMLPDTGQDEVTEMAGRLNRLAAALYSEREEMLLSAIESLVTALEAKDAYTYGHSSQVSAIASGITSQLNLSEQEQFTIKIAALLHDIGKIGIPDHVLNKQSRLDADEREIIEQHPVIGAKILAGIPALARVTELVKHHHARWDGQGYPEPLTGQDIPLGARIIAVADTYQAMTSDRPYRKGLSPDVAKDEISRCAGSQFDPTVVSAFNRAHEKF
ncbi:MAG TPA: HD domain-containing protein [Selenomonadales bacterium]|nr:HD domain-containing protein [Selenomonadales bacterium]